MTSDGSGPNLQGSWASYDPDTSLWKTYQGSLFGGLEMFSGTWPNSGTMRNGVVFPLRPWVPLISVSGSSLWRTPQATDGDHGGPNARDSGGGLHLSAQVHRWPTPTAMTGGEGVAPSHKNGKHGWNTAAAVHDSMNEKPTRMWPTPTRADASGHGRVTPDKRTLTHNTGTSLVDATGGQLNPTWVEWLMGFPAGWTDLEDSGTPSCPK